MFGIFFSTNVLTLIARLDNLHAELQNVSRVHTTWLRLKMYPPISCTLPTSLNFKNLWSTSPRPTDLQARLIRPSLSISQLYEPKTTRIPLLLRRKDDRCSRTFRCCSLCLSGRRLRHRGRERRDFGTEPVGREFVRTLFSSSAMPI